MTISYTVRPLFDNESCTWTYLLIDNSTRKAAIIDSVIEQTERDLLLISELDASLEYIMETHIHADHITGASVIKEHTGAKIVYGDNANVEGADIKIEDNATLLLGQTTITAISTPGHTSCSICYLVEGAAFTGDTLFIRGCGRTDFQEGSAKMLFDNVRDKLFTLPDETTIYPGHDYKGMLCSTIGEEKAHNPRLKMDNNREDFSRIMDNLNLPYPEKIDIAVPANLKVGALDSKSA